MILGTSSLFVVLSLEELLDGRLGSLITFCITVDARRPTSSSSHCRGIDCSLELPCLDTRQGAGYICTITPWEGMDLCAEDYPASSMI